MFMILFYDALLVLLALFFICKIPFDFIFYKKSRNNLLQRFGVGFPDIQKGKRKLIWVHAVSMGETKAIAPLVKELKKRDKSILVVVSSVTDTGHVEGKKSVPEADYHVYLPFDLKWVVGPIVRRVKPDVVILCETDFWYNFLASCKKEGASILLVNGKLSEKSLERYKKYRWFSGPLFKLIDKFCLQNNYYKERFLSLGIPSEKIEVTGNIKMDGHYPQLSETELEAWKQKFSIRKDDIFFVAGSTHDPEEKIVLDAIEKIWQKIPRLHLLLVPRHPERFQEVAALLERRRIAFKLYSQLPVPDNKARVVLMDRMGLLRQCYQLADVAFVGGTYAEKVGGHNILEPSGYGVPVLFGPYLHSQPEMVDLVREYKSGIQVEAAEFSGVLADLIANPDKRYSIGQAGLQMNKELSGATQRTFQSISSFLAL